ncbi:MAG: BBP7 family outer membrane beta-barrel protein [Gemmataceae bacterium]|nr:BBP7 family outer membrane beta-barrel protein [Gemmataceae bacterium]
MGSGRVSAPEHCCGCCYRVDLLAGYRFLSLDEDLTISEIEIGTGPDDPLRGVPFFIDEGFSASNDFHGGQIGVIAEWARCRTFVRLVGKVALGGNSRTVTINGVTRVDGLAPETGGFLALPSNIGRYTSTEFAVVPEVGLTLGYQLTPRLRVMMGYSFLYWTNVARPGDQIDLAVNTSQPPLGNGLVGQARPASSFGDSDFWAHGLSFGFEFRY